MCTKLSSLFPLVVAAACGANSSPQTSRRACSTDDCKVGHNEPPRIAGTRWASPIPNLLQEWERITALHDLGDQLLIGHISQGIWLSFTWDGELSAQPGNAGGAVPGFEAFKEFDADVYGVGLTGDGFGVMKFSRENNAWDFVYQSNNPLYDMARFGDLTVMAAYFAPHIRAFGGVAPQEFTTGLDGPVYALEVFNGELYAGGEFSSCATTPCSNIARWDGINWQPVGSGLDDGVYDLDVFAGALIAGGRFKASGEQAGAGTMSWDGESWQPLGGGLDTGLSGVTSLHVHHGQLFVGGQFAGSSDVLSRNIIGWNGEQWQALPSGVPDTVGDIAVFDEHLWIGNKYGSTTPFLLRLD